MIGTLVGYNIIQPRLLADVGSAIFLYLRFPMKFTFRVGGENMFKDLPLFVVYVATFPTYSTTYMIHHNRSDNRSLSNHTNNHDNDSPGG